MEKSKYLTFSENTCSCRSPFFIMRRWTNHFSGPRIFILFWLLVCLLIHTFVVFPCVLLCDEIHWDVRNGRIKQRHGIQSGESIKSIQLPQLSVLPAGENARLTHTSHQLFAPHYRHNSLTGTRCWLWLQWPDLNLAPCEGVTATGGVLPLTCCFQEMKLWSISHTAAAAIAK